MPSVFADVFADVIRRDQLILSAHFDHGLKDAWRAIHLSAQQGYQLLLTTLDRFEEIQRRCISQKRGADRERAVSDLHSLFESTVPPARLEAVIEYALETQCFEELGLSPSSPSFGRGLLKTGATDLRSAVATLVGRLEDVGLGGDHIQRAYARVLDKLLGQWLLEFDAAKADVSEEQNFKQIVQEQFGDLIRRVASTSPALDFRNMGTKARQRWTISENPNADAFEEWISARTGSVLAQQLFDTVIAADASPEKVSHLKGFLTTPASRGYAAHELRERLKHQLLTPASSTVELLDTYMKTMDVCRAADATGVLLAASCAPIGQLLLQREDSIRLILLSMLESSSISSTATAAPRKDISIKIAQAMQKHVNQKPGRYYEGVDLKKADWTPEPIEAGPGHGMFTYSDPIQQVVTIHRQEAFVRELQSVVGERLLASGDLHLEAVMRLIELLKARFDDASGAGAGGADDGAGADGGAGSSSLQQCEVMLNDVLDSQHRHDHVEHAKEREAQQHHHRRPSSQRRRPSKSKAPPPAANAEAEAEPAAAFRAMVLSTYYWPPLHDTTFPLPAPMARHTADYELRFRHLKPNRRLRWLTALGHARVRLELADRTVDVDASAWHAAVLYQFTNPEQSAGGEAEEAGTDKTAKKTAKTEKQTARSTRRSTARTSTSTSTSNPSAQPTSPSARPAPATRTLTQLSTALSTEPTSPLLHSALAFWQQHGILRPHPTDPSTFSVRETTTPPSSPGPSTAATSQGATSSQSLQPSNQPVPVPAPAPAPAPGAASALGLSAVAPPATSALKPASALLVENARIYTQFVSAMLTNQGAMPATRVLHTLKMMVPGGFPFDEPELVAFLERMAVDGRVRCEAGLWKAVKGV